MSTQKERPGAGQGHPGLNKRSMSAHKGSKEPTATQPAAGSKPNGKGREAVFSTPLEGALHYAAMGFRIICLRHPGEHYKDKKGKPKVANGKEPRHSNWQTVENTSDPAKIKGWAAKHPGCNFGLAMGHEYGDGVIMAIDIEKEGVALLGANFHGIPRLPETLVHSTAGSGLHVFIIAPRGVVFANHLRINGLPLDIRHFNEQVVCPGSVACSKHADDPTVPAPYTVFRAAPIVSEGPLRDKWIEYLTKAQSAPQAKVAPHTKNVARGQQDRALLSTMGKMQREGKSEEEKRTAWLEQVATFDVIPSDPFTEADFQRHIGYVEKFPPVAEHPEVERMAREWWWDVPAEKMVRVLSEEPIHYTLGKMKNNIIAPEAPRVTVHGFHAAEIKAGMIGEAMASKVFFKSPLRRDYYGECYVPHGPEDDKPKDVWNEVIGAFQWNVYRAAGIVPAQGDVSLFLKYLAALIENPKEQELVRRWWAWIIRHPDEPLDHMLLIWSRKRHIGKSLLGKIMAILVGPTNVQIVNDKDLESDFAPYLRHSVVVRAEEITQGTKKEAAQLFNFIKCIIGENTGRPNRKNREEPMQALYSNLYMTSNSPLALHIEVAEWRLLVIEAGTGKEPFGKDQFNELVSWVNSKEGQAALLHYFLHEVDMEGFDAHNGAPLTAARTQMAEAGRDVLQRVFDSMSTEQGRESLFAEIAHRFGPQWTDGSSSLPAAKCCHYTPRELADIFNVVLELEGRDKFSAQRMGSILDRQGVRKRGGNEVRINSSLVVKLWEVDEEGAKVPNYRLKEAFLRDRPYLPKPPTTPDKRKS